MTAYYQPLQRERDKRWDMTRSTGSSGPHPIGYCCGWHEPAREVLEKTWGPNGHMVDAVLRDYDRLRPFKDKYHEDGHATAEEASACWDDYRLDNELEFTTSVDTMKKCGCCGAWTPTVGYFRGAFYEETPLCSQHTNRDGMAEAIKKRKEERAAKESR